jgi:hypothetical protein
MSNCKNPASTDKKETWINYLAFTTVIFAALATLSTFKGELVLS